MRKHHMLLAFLTAAGIASYQAFGNTQQRRDPFWPVDYKKVTESELRERTIREELQSRINWPSLPLRGITHAGGRRFIAVIDRIGLVETGDIISIREDNLVYRWRIDEINASGLKSTRLDVTELSNSK